MTTPETGRPPAAPQARRVWLRGLRAFFRSAAFAAGTLPTWAAFALYAAAIAAAAMGTPLPLVTFLAAFAAGASLPKDAGRALGAVSLLWATGLLLPTRVEPEVRATAAMALGFALGAITVGGRLKEPGAAVEDARAAFLVAAQRHPWVCTLVLVAVVDATRGAGTATSDVVRALWSVVPALALHATIQMTARGPGLLGRLAPLALGLPPAAVVCYGLWLSRNLHDVEFATAAGIAAPLGLLLAYATGRRVAESLPVSVAWALLGAAAGGTVLAAARARPLEATAIACAAAGPLLLAAGSRVSVRPLPALIGASVATALLLVAAVRLEPSGIPVFFFGAVRAAPDADAWLGADVLVRGLTLGAAWMGLCAILRAARSMSALPYDHPVFTEGPYVQWRRTETRAAAPDAPLPAPAEARA